ncbi:MAG: glycine cleavage system protein GcvH [Chloroflexota bacterium]|nr:glycine cleavage system protein GcvH [Chloroflexota bacterium]
MNPPECCYTREHEWVRREDNRTVIIGITHYAQEQLGDIVYLDLPAPGTSIEQLKKFGEIESVKAVSDLFAPVSGVVKEINQQAIEHPEMVNQEPYVRGWLLRVTLTDPAELERLLTAAEYDRVLIGQS